MDALYKRNIRDLSYLRRGDGLSLPPSLFYRGAKLYHLKKKEREAFLRLGVSLIIDLRTSVECQKKPDDVFEGVRYLAIPLLKEETIGVTHEGGIGGYGKPPHMPELYSKMVSEESSIGAIKEVLQVLFASKNETVYVHCTEGKDRSGIIVALFLSALGFDVEDILRDYEATNEITEPKGVLYRRLVRIFLFNKVLAQSVYQTMLAKREFLLAALDTIKERFGGMKKYLYETLGLDKKTVESYANDVLVKP